MGRPSSSFGKEVFGKEVEGCKSGCVTAGGLLCGLQRLQALGYKKPLKTSPREGGDGRA